MLEKRVFIVHLRRPTKDRGEMRSDPFWEHGSFGLTKCHSRNLLNPRNATKLNGARLAFVQGGKQGMKLLYLTPEVQICEHGDRFEAVWSPATMPFTYSAAPIIVSKTGKTAFPKFEAALKNGKRTTLEGQFSSNFRSRTTPIDERLAHELLRNYAARRRRAEASAIARSYVEALPWAPPKPDRDRERTYENLLNDAGGERLTRKTNRARHSLC